MLLSESQLNFIFIYFIYGLAFFGMGLVLTLEAGRSPRIAEARILRPLAVFGYLHGLHEWFEMFLSLGDKLGYPIGNHLLWIRIGLLVISFASLIAYGVQVLRPPRRLAALDAYIGGGLLLLYSALVIFLGFLFGENVVNWTNYADIVARYFLAVPGGFITAMALRQQAKNVQLENRKNLGNSLYVAAFGFLIYGLTQVIVIPMEIFPANIINTEVFATHTGLPIQIVRTFLVILITSGLIKATQIVEKERQEQLSQVQKERYDALEQVQNELVKRELMRQKLLRHTVIAQEEERSRIARELHDETAQLLTAFSLDLATLRNSIEKVPELIDLLDRLQATSRQVSQGLYRLVHDLRPAQLDDLGVVPAIKHLTEKNQKRGGVQVTLKIQGNIVRLDPIIETVLFRFVQEALTNITRHAKTDQAMVEIRFTPSEVTLFVEDYGVGFEDKTLDKPHTIGWGIAGMRERVSSVGGIFHLKTAPGKGTHIKTVIPINRGEHLDN